MGMIQHRTLVLTSCEEKLLRKVNRKAKTIFKKHKLLSCVAEIAGEGMNGYKTFFIAPSGSKLGWGVDQDHEAATNLLIERISGLKDKELIEAVSVSFGEFPAQVEVYG